MKAAAAAAAAVLVSRSSSVDSSSSNFVFTLCDRTAAVAQVQSGGCHREHEQSVVE